MNMTHPYSLPKGLAGVDPTRGLVCGSVMGKAFEDRCTATMEMLSELYVESTGISVDLTALDKSHQHMLMGMAENLVAHHGATVASGNTHNLLFSKDGSANGLRQHYNMDAAVNSTDIADYTRQQLVFVVDVFAPLVFTNFVTTIALTGPTAFIHRQTYTREDASTFYAAGSALVDGFDPSYSDCAAECSASNGIDVEITAELVEVDCKSLAGTYCMPAQWHVSSQYGRNLDQMLMEGITTELQRGTAGDVLADIEASVGNSVTWNETPDPASFFATAHPDEWRKELFSAVNVANQNMLKASDGRVAASMLIGDIDALAILEEPQVFEFVDQQPDDIISGRIDQTSEFLGRTKNGRFNTWRVFEGLSSKTLILMARNDNDPTYIYAPWIPITGLGTLIDPELRQVKMGAMSLFGNVAVKTGRIQEINIGA